MNSMKKSLFGIEERKTEEIQIHDDFIDQSYEEIEHSSFSMSMNSEKKR